MKHIYVIWNGFDIDLGWHTSYKEFYDTKLTGWKVHFRPNDDCLPKYLLDHAGENWYDLERTIYDYCLSKSKGNLDKDSMSRDYQDYVSIKGQLERFVKERSSEPVEVKSKAYELLTSYVERSSHTDLPSDMRPELISFNYTPLDKVVKQINPKVELKYIPIHGTIEKNSCIFGFHDDIHIKGLYRDMQKSMDDNYNPGRIMPLLMDAKTITFFGLSMGYIDAVYFKEEWSEKLNEKNTIKKSFYNLNDQSKVIQIDKMIKTDYSNYYDDNEIQMVELPYKKDSMSAIIILPKEKININNYISNLNDEKLQQIFKRMRNVKVHLELPKFELEFSSSLKSTLQKLGMDQPFNKSTADFSEMRKEKDIYIDEVIQKTYLKVDEGGTEAAAAANELLIASAGPDEAEKIEIIIINRPFLFLLRNKKLPKNYEMMFMAKIETLK